MQGSVTVGLPSMHVEAGERRAFLPDFVSRIDSQGVQVNLEYDYGSGMSFQEADYLQAARGVRFVDHAETYHQDYVLVLRCPSEADMMEMDRGACLISMLHYPTNPKRTQFIRSLGINAVSLDSIVDDSGKRLVENMRAVAWNGLETAFLELRKSLPGPGFNSPDREPIKVTLLGSGMVGMQVLPAAIRYGDDELWKQMAVGNVPGVQLTAVDYDTTNHELIMLEILSETDILVDATQRPDASKVIVKNSWIEVMPRHAVLLDLSVDPYDRADPPGVQKGIEGMPHGSLDKYVFNPEDPEWDATVPENVPSTHRRTAVTCYSWPGVHPRACMAHYGEQFAPLMSKLIETGYDGLNTDGDYYTRALYRASLKAQ